MRITACLLIALAAGCSNAPFVPKHDGGNSDSGSLSDGSSASDGGGGHYMGGDIPISATEVGIGTGGSLTTDSFGLYVTGNFANGNTTFRVVWTGKSGTQVVHHHFTGSLWSPGNFSGVIPGCTDMACALEGNDWVSTPMTVSEGLRLDFDTDASDGLDGLEMTSDQGILFVNVLIDGAPAPNAIYIVNPSGTQQAAGADPVKLISS